MKKIVAIVMGLVLLMVAMSFAQGAAPQRDSQKGTITSIDGSKLVMTGTRGFSKLETTFVLNGDTKKDGNLKVGAFVIVYFRIENNQKIAERVKTI